MVRKKKNIVPTPEGSGASRRNEILQKVIPWGKALITEAESFGINWREMTMAQILGEVVFATEFSKEKR